MLVEAPKIDSRYILAHDIDQPFMEAFINAPSHLTPPARHRHAFLFGVMGIDPESERVKTSLETEYFIDVGDFYNRKDLSTRPMSEEEIERFMRDAKKVSGRKPASLEQAIGILATVDNPTISINRPVGEEGDMELSGFLPDEGLSVEKEAINGELRTKLADVFASRLNPREIRVLMLRFVEEMTLEQVGKIYGVTRERVRQIQSKALWKIGPELRRRGFNDYLK